MEKTSIEHFNSYLKLFINNIIETFSEFEEVLKEYYKELLENDQCNDDKYVKRFMKKLQTQKNNISNKNDDLFKESIFILKNVDFNLIWHSEELSENNKDVIWDYIQTLYILGETIVSDSDKVKQLLDNFKKVKEGNFDETDETIDKDILDMFKNLSENKNNTIDENFLENCSLGKLASELTSEINLDDMNLDLTNTENVDEIFGNLLSGDNSMNFMNLIQKVGSKIQNKIESGDFNQEKLVDEAQQMMSSLQGGGFNNIFSQMANNEVIQNMNNESSNPTRDRLRKKLEKRK